MLTDWQIPIGTDGANFTRQIYKRLQVLSKPFGFYCALWFAAKYRKPDEIVSLIQGKKSSWAYDPFLRRQVISILPRILSYKPEFCQEMLAEELSLGMEDSASVAANIKYLGKLEKLSFEVNSYLFPQSKQSPYPLPKYLVLLSCLKSEYLQEDLSIKDKVKEYVSDPWYLHWLETYLPTAVV